MTGTPRRSIIFLPAAAALVMLASALRAAPAASGPLPQLSRFVWSEQGESISFSMQMSSATRPPRLTDEIGQKKYFYLDFFNCLGPAEEKQWTLVHPLIASVRRVYYPSVRALRLIFITATDNPLNLAAEGFGADFTLKASPIVMSQYGKIAPGKPGSRKVIVIDPGHGGISSGARTSRSVNGRHYQEKEITLQIGHRLAALIRQSPNMDCVMTRAGDHDVGLEERVRIAEEAKGDLFVSLHLNATSSRAKTARGLEVYYLSDSMKAANNQIEQLENEGSLGGRMDAAGNEQVKSLLGSLATDMVQTRRQESLRLSTLIDESFRRQGPFAAHPRGVKSAAFRVLMNFGMPAVLVEAGFIDNPQDAALLTDPVSQQQIAALLFNALNRYFSQLDPKFQPREVALQSAPARPAIQAAPKPAPRPAAAARKPQTPAAKSATRPAPRKK